MTMLYRDDEGYTTYYGQSDEKKAKSRARQDASGSAEEYRKENGLGEFAEPTPVRKQALKNAGVGGNEEKSSSAKAPVQTNTGSAAQGNDWRAKLTLSPAAANSLLIGSMFNTLRGASGIIFPYTPTIFIQHMGNYGSSGLTHSNFDHPAFESHTIGEVQITAEMTANSSAEADYMRATLHFLRVVTKMFFGQDSDPIAGTPPPVCRINAYGDYVLRNVPVVVVAFNMELGNQVDYIRTSDGKTMMPSHTTFTCTCKPAYSRAATSNRFGLKEFASGALMGGPSQGGFI